MRSKLLIGLTAAASVALAGQALAQDAHVTDFNVGADAVTPPAAIIFEEPAQPSTLLSLLDSGVWIASNPATTTGFDSEEEPDEGLFAFVTGADIWLEIISITGAGFLMTDGVNLADAPGELISLGGSTLHIHPIWGMFDDGNTLADELATVTFRLVDLGTTGYTASENFELTFSNFPIPEPASASLLALGAAALLRRGRRN